MCQQPRAQTPARGRQQQRRADQQDSWLVRGYVAASLLDQTAYRRPRLPQNLRAIMAATAAGRDLNVATQIDTRAVDTRTSTGEAVRVALFYLVLGVLLVIITTKHLADILPTHLAHRISDNSEGYTIAFVACAWLQFVRPGGRDRRNNLLLSLAGGGICLVIALIFKNADSLPVSVATLNEAWFALAFLLVYFALPRPLRWAPLLSLAIVIGLLAAHDTSVVVKGAEAWMVLILAPLSFDVFDRAILDPDARESHLLRLVWMAGLIAVPVLAAALRHHVGHGHAEGIRDYVSRANEAFIGLLIIHAYVGYWARSALAGHRALATSTD